MPLTAPNALLPVYLRLVRANRIMATQGAARTHVHKQALRPTAYGPPRLLRRDVEISVDQRNGWPVYRVSPANAASRGGFVYVHGGAWVNQIVLQHWQFVAQMAAEARITVTVPIYPLVPFGTAAEVVGGVVGLVQESIERYGATGIGGDSAGGQIALSAAQVLRDEDGTTLPRTVLIAPALDLSFNNPEIPVVQPRDPWLAVEGTRVFVDHWRGDLPLEDPLVSPIKGDLTGLGPISIFIGGRDICLPDNRLLRELAEAAGVAIDYHELADQYHVYPLLPTRAGAEARELIVAQLRATSPH